jgi:anti-sigma factor RsiW
VQCAEHLAVQAAFDGELDAVAQASVERHAELCPECRALRASLERTRAALRRDLDYGQASPELRARIARGLDAEVAREAEAASQSVRPASRWPRPFWLGAASGLGAAALAATLVFVLLVPLRSASLPDELVTAHLAALRPAHLTEVVSTDRHTVKPWFAGHADVSPVVADFAAQGYTLVGGRADYLEHQRAAVLVYRHGAHLINVFAFAPGRQVLPAATTRRGYHISCWQAADLGYCMVSDAGWDEMQGLARLLQDLAARDAR